MKSDRRSGLLITGGMFIGIGIGFLFDHVTAGTLIGLGCGFIAAFAALKLEKKGSMKKSPGNKTKKKKKR